MTTKRSSKPKPRKKPAPVSARADAVERLKNLRDCLPEAQTALIETLSQWEGNVAPLAQLAMFLDLVSVEVADDLPAAPEVQS